MKNTIRIVSSFLHSNDLFAELGSCCSATSDVELQLHDLPQRFRGVDPTIVVALVGAAGGGLGVLLAGIFKIAEKRQVSYIELEGKDWRVKVPAGISQERIEELIELARTNNVDRVELAL